MHSNSLMVDISEIYILSLKLINKELLIEITKHNTRYFNRGKELFFIYRLIFTNYIAFCDENKKIMTFIDFLKDSVKNNIMLSDTIKEIDFNIEEEHILFLHNDEEVDYINMGEFKIDNCICNVCNSYLFIEDTLNKKKYMYYAD